MPQIAAFTGVGVESGDQDTRLLDAVFAPHVAVQDTQGLLQRRRGDGGRHVLQGQVRRRQGHAQTASGEHHDHLRRAGFLGEIFGVAGEGDAGIVDDALVYRRGDHRGKFATLATAKRPVEQSEHVAGIGGIQPAWQ